MDLQWSLLNVFLLQMSQFWAVTGHMGFSKPYLRQQISRLQTKCTVSLHACHAELRLRHIRLHHVPTLTKSPRLDAFDFERRLLKPHSTTQSRTVFLCAKRQSNNSLWDSKCSYAQNLRKTAHRCLPLGQRRYKKCIPYNNCCVV